MEKLASHWDNGSLSLSLSLVLLYSALVATVLFLMKMIEKDDVNFDIPFFFETKLKINFLLILSVFQSFGS
jgi:hypothetical protein